MVPIRLSVANVDERRKLLLAFIVFAVNFFSGIAYSQPAWKVGLYKSEKEFLHRQPSISNPFTIVPIYKVIKQKDSILIGYSYKFLDSTRQVKIFYGVFDGKDMYLRASYDILNKFDYLGKYPFITLQKRRELPHSNNLLTLGVLFSDYLVAGVNEEIWYYNKKGRFLKATKQAIQFLLREDEDLKKQFEEEKAFNNNTFRKYLIKMNERPAD